MADGVPPMPGVLSETDTAVGVRFLVRIDDVSLGAFSSLNGLKCEVVMETIQEGGNNDHEWNLPSRLKYENVTLTRPLGPATARAATWVSSVARGYRPTTAQIVAMAADGKRVAEWGLVDVLPVSWSGPSFDPSTQKVLEETLVLAHHGFRVWC